MLPELGVILDAGTGIFRARDLIQTKHLDIFLSHVHLDHVIGLTFLFDILHEKNVERVTVCLLYTSPSPRDKRQSRMPSSA